MKKRALKHQMHKTTFLPSPVARGGGRRSITALAVAACFGVVPATVRAAPEEKKQMTDQAITNDVDHMLLTDSALLNNQIDATTSEGIVTLSGTADHLPAKARATKLAETIRGVRSVVNTIKLHTAARTDEEIRKDVESAFLYDAATDSYELTPAAKDDLATISGTVQSYREKELAIYVAKGVKDVKEVKSNITLNGIKAKARAGVITLTGTVDCWSGYQSATGNAYEGGARSVINNLTVK